VNKCRNHKYGKLPAKLAITTPLGSILHGPHRTIHPQR
jgi:hypothetical protein